MPDTYEMTCWVCFEAFDIETYGDGECPECHRRYEYIEGHAMELSETDRGTLGALPRKTG